MKILFKISIYTYIILLLSLLSGTFREILLVYIIIIIHEFGHIVLMKLYSIDINKITLYPYGGLIDTNMLINANSKAIFVISLGGVLIQIVLLIIIYLFFKFNIISVYYYLLLKKLNVFIIIFNILPIYPLDGYKLLNSVLELFFSFKTSINISIIINMIFIFLLIVYLYIFKISNYVLVSFLLVSFINYIKNLKYIYNKFYLERIIYDLKLNGLVSVRSKDNMYKNRYNYINGIDEKDYLLNNI